MKLLVSDLHLTDNPQDEYRWGIFNDILKQDPDDIYILGDLADRKDRHSAELVNRMTQALLLLTQRCPVTILLGNHDFPLRGTPFWTFLNHLENVRFITQPTALGNLLMLPYSANPRDEWRGIDFSLYRCAFIHQTVTGVMSDNGHRLENDKMPLFPRKLIVYAGDIHTPQKIGNVTYVGSPYPIKFGDDYKCRMLVLDDDWLIQREIVLNPMRKRIVRVASVEALDGVVVKRGDRVRLTVSIGPEDVVGWPGQQAAFRAWATEKGVELTLLEAQVEVLLPGETPTPSSVQTDPKQVLRDYAVANGLDKTHINFGLKLLEEVI